MDPAFSSQTYRRHKEIGGKAAVIGAKCGTTRRLEMLDILQETSRLSDTDTLQPNGSSAPSTGISIRLRTKK
jgi:hypothetical protein